MITTVQYFLGPPHRRIPLALRVLVLSGTVVPVVVYAPVPAVLRLIGPPTRNRP